MLHLRGPVFPLEAPGLVGSTKPSNQGNVQKKSMSVGISNVRA